MDESANFFAISALVSIIGAMLGGAYLFFKAGYPVGRVVSNSLWMTGFSIAVILLFMIVWAVIGLPEEFMPALFPVVVFCFFYWIKNNYSENPQNIPNDGNVANQSKNNERIFQCPSCSQRLRINIPAPQSIGICNTCGSRYKLSEDNNDYLYVYLLNDSNEKYEAALNIGNCYEILEVSQTSSPNEIKTAYKIKMKEYHPDKVSRLGKELHKLAERKSKEINRAYNMLKEHGLAE